MATSLSVRRSITVRSPKPRRNLPIGGAQPVHPIGAEQPAPLNCAAVSRAVAAEVAQVEGAIERNETVEFSYGHLSTVPRRGCRQVAEA